MNYEAWRMTYQDSEQSARAAFKLVCELSSELKELKNDKLAQDAAYNAIMAQRDALRSFARDLLRDASFYGCTDNSDLQERASKHGILIENTYNEPCDDECECSITSEPPWECYHFPDFMVSDENEDTA